LKNELVENTWIVSDQYHPDVVFSNDEGEVWREVIVSLGPKYAHVSKFPSDPNLN
jgi:putative transcriptional regulator